MVVGSLAAVGLTFGPATATAGTTHVFARPGAPGKPKIVTFRSTDTKLTMSDTKFRPGVTEFRVRATAHRGSSVAIVESDNLQKAFKKIGIATAGGPGSADAMKAFDRLVTVYGGGAEGAVWQVRLSKGSYYALDTKTNQLTTFTIKGDPRGAQMATPDVKVHTTKDNHFETSGPLAGPWVQFTNGSKEIHFFEASRVTKDTTARDVRKAMKSNDGGDFFLKGGFFFEIQSPGITTVHKQDVHSGRYLVMCWMPSEQQDGTPHAMMGMWLLVNAV